VVIGLEMSAAELRGEKFDYGARIKADEEKPKTRLAARASGRALWQTRIELSVERARDTDQPSPLMIAPDS